MKPINEVILDLVGKGFVLPKGLLADGDGFRLSWDANDPGNSATLRKHRTVAIDAIACEFARQVDDMEEVSMSMDVLQRWKGAMLSGDTEAALHALWEACCE